MAFKLKLFKNKSKRNKIKKELVEVGEEIDCIIKDGTSIENPTVIVNGITMAEINTFNYFRIVFGEDDAINYFVTDKTMLRGRQLAISGHIDVLYTYRNDILDSKQIAVRSESSINKYMVDNSLPIDSDNSYSIKKFGVPVFDKEASHVIMTTVGRGTVSDT